MHDKYVAAIERQNRLLRGMLVTLLAVVGVGLLSGAVRDEPDEIRTHRLIILGPDGRGVGAFFADKDSCVLTARHGASQIILGTDNEDASVLIEKGKQTAGLGCTTTDARFEMTSPGFRAGMFCNKESARTNIEADGKVRATLVASGDTTAGRINGPDGAIAWEVSSLPKEP